MELRLDLGREWWIVIAGDSAGAPSCRGLSVGGTGSVAVGLALESGLAPFTSRTVPFAAAATFGPP